MLDGQVSETARRVASLRLRFERVSTDYGDPDADQALHADIATGFDSAASPMGPYLQARTTWIDRTVVAAIDEGVDQVVVAGAGYDGRALRYAKPGVRWFEVDHPATQADKVDRLARVGLATDHIAFVAADFGVDDVGERLADAGLDAARPCLAICEGVAGYIPTDMLGRLIAGLARGAAPGSQLAITISLEPESPSEVERRARLQNRVSGVGEPLLTAIPRGELRDLMADAGWSIERAVDATGTDVERSPRSYAFVTATRPASTA